MKHEIIKFYPLQVWYVKPKHDTDPNSNINYRRKIPHSLRWPFVVVCLALLC